jgi:predicted transposase/invertase (TIGR01784 family)
MERRQLNPLADPVFKRVFGEEKEILMELINAIIGLEHPVVQIDYLPPELLPESNGEKTTIVDVRCIDDLNRHFIVEMQLVPQQDLQKRVFFNATRVYGRQIGKGINYGELQPVYALCFVDHVLYHETKRWKHKYVIINEEDPNRKITEMELHFIELSKCRKRKDINFTDPLDRWIKFFIDPSFVKKASMESTFDYPNLKKAVKLLDESNYTEGQLIAYDNYLASVMSWNTTMMHQFDEGKAEGRVEEREKILGIIMDLKSGMPPNEVAGKYDVEMELVDMLR